MFHRDIASMQGDKVTKPLTMVMQGHLAFEDAVSLVGIRTPFCWPVAAPSFCSSRMPCFDPVNRIVSVSCIICVEDLVLEWFEARLILATISVMSCCT